MILLDGQAWQDNRTRFRFEFDPARYPDPKAVLDELHALNFKVCVWEYPMVSVRGPLFAEFEAKGWLLKDPATGRAVVHDWGEASLDPLSPLQPSGLIDFTHPDAYEYWRDGHARAVRARRRRDQDRLRRAGAAALRGACDGQWR